MMIQMDTNPSPRIVCSYEVGHGISETAGDAKERVKGAAQSASESVQGAAESAKEKGKSMMEKIKDTLTPSHE